MARRRTRRADQEYNRDQCPSHKRGFRSEAAVRRFLRVLASQPFAAGTGHRHPYRCNLCSAWHITSQEPRNRP